MLEALGSQDPQAVEKAVTELERARATPDGADALFAAARACEHKLADPARALALYDRIVHELPDARVAAASQRRAERLRAQLGPANAYGIEAKQLARLIADADRLESGEVVDRAAALAAAAWPGAPDAALWLAEWLRRIGRFGQAEAAYREVVVRWPSSSQALLARRGAAGAALDQHAWSHAVDLARALPVPSADDVLVRDELLQAAEQGRLRDRLYTRAWVGLVVAIFALFASLAEAILRGGKRWPSVRPPIEILYLAPLGAVLIAISFTAHRAITPVVASITLAGIVLAWISGVTLDLLRARERSVKARAILHILMCTLGVVATGYIVMMHGGLLDLLAETVRSGPEP